MLKGRGVSVRYKLDDELLKRTVSGLVLAVAFLSGIYVGGIYWQLLCSAAAILSLREYYGLLSIHFHVSKGIGFGAAIAILSATWCSTRAEIYMVILVVSTFAVFICEIIRRELKGYSTALHNVGGTLSGLLYVVLPWSFIIQLRFNPLGPILLLALFACTWSCDVVAFFAGKRWGRAPLSPAVSPKKTWEGFFSGLLASILCATFIAYALTLPPFPLALMGILVGIAGQLGDLSESLLKRETGVKDSGHLIPGHGGLLDRFDSIILSGTLFYLLFELLF